MCRISEIEYIINDVKVQNEKKKQNISKRIIATLLFSVALERQLCERSQHIRLGWLMQNVMRSTVLRNCLVSILSNERSMQEDETMRETFLSIAVLRSLTEAWLNFFMTSVSTFQHYLMFLFFFCINSSNS